MTIKAQNGKGAPTPKAPQNRRSDVPPPLMQMFPQDMGASVDKLAGGSKILRLVFSQGGCSIVVNLPVSAGETLIGLLQRASAGADIEIPGLVLPPTLESA